MKHRIIQTNILLLVMLCCFAAGGDVQEAGSIETAGNVLLIALPVAAAGLTLNLRDDQGALEFGESMALTLGVTYGLKYSIDEERPNGGSKSFPSAHASISFTSAEFMRKRYGWNYGIPAYAAAMFVAYSRVEADEHYTRDVIAGAAIGIASSYLFTQTYNGWAIQPDADQSYFGIRLNRSW